MCVVLFAQKQSSSFLVVMSLLNIDEHTLSSFWSTPSGPLLNFPSPLEPSRITAAAPLRGESGRMADWTSNTGYEPKIGLNFNTELTTICNQVDNYQEKASFEYFRSSRARQVTNQQPQICSKDGTDSDWFQCRWLLETRV